MGDQWKTEAGVARILESFGLHVERVNVGKAKTPDLLVSDGRQRYVVEVKDRLYDVEKHQRKNDVLNAGGVWEDQTHLAYSNAISKVIRNAAEQLAAIPDPNVFRLVWLHARDREEIQLSQFEATLYGSADLIDLSEIAASVPARPCFYFYSSEFFRLRNTLDAAFVASDERGLLCVNNLSPRYEQFRRSRLCEVFPAICDPVIRERDGSGYIADCDRDRHDKAGMLKFVQAKYKRSQLIEFAPKVYSASVAVRHKA